MKEKLFTISRRDVLKWLAGTAAAPILFEPCRLFAQPQAVKPGKAKSIIQIWMWGGPSHLDTFDPKPAAGSDYCGPYTKPITTNVKDIQINEMLPLLAGQADKYSIIRSMTHGINGHETAAYMVQTGHKPGELLVYPSVGAVVSMFKGYDAGYQGLIPPYIILTTSLGRFSEVGFLGPRYKPFVTGGNPNSNPFAVEGIVAQGITEKQQQDRRQLLGKLDLLGKAMPENANFDQFNQCQDKAYNLILGDERKLFDLSQETNELREQYGRTWFGQSCLMARRLVEKGVPFIAINYNGWDTHKRHFETMRRSLPEFDKGLSMLLKDLNEKGLLDNTIVWCGGEFGRTPKVMWEEPWNGGRGHYGKCFSTLVAGGGFKGGRVVGASSDRGEEVAERPVYPQDLIGSMYELLGIDPDGPLQNPMGMDIKVMPASADGKGVGRLREIM
jgi:hypothetical protein